jgi:hypothetical protein
VDNDIVAGDPVDGGGNLVFVACLKRVDNAKDFGGVSTSRRGVGKDGSDDLLGVLCSIGSA